MDITTCPKCHYDTALRAVYFGVTLISCKHCGHREQNYPDTPRMGQPMERGLPEGERHYPDVDSDLDWAIWSWVDFLEAANEAANKATFESYMEHAESAFRTAARLYEKGAGV